MHLIHADNIAKIYSANRSRATSASSPHSHPCNQTPSTQRTHSAPSPIAHYDAPSPLARYSAPSSVPCALERLHHSRRNAAFVNVAARVYVIDFATASQTFVPTRNHALQRSNNHPRTNDPPHGTTTTCTLSSANVATATPAIRTLIPSRTFLQPGRGWGWV